MVLFVILFLMLDGTVSVSYEPKPSIDACRVDGKKFNEGLQAMNEEDMKKLGLQTVIAWCDDKIILKIQGGLKT